MSEINERAHADAARILGTTPGCSTCVAVGQRLAARRALIAAQQDTITRLTRERDEARHTSFGWEREAARWKDRATAAEANAVQEREFARTAEADRDRMMVSLLSAEAVRDAARARIAELEGAAKYAAAELRHAFREQRRIDPGLVARAIEMLEKATTPTAPAAATPTTPPQEERGICRACNGSGENTPHDLCFSCGGDGAEHPTTPASEQAGDVHSTSDVECAVCAAREITEEDWCGAHTEVGEGVGYMCTLLFTHDGDHRNVHYGVSWPRAEQAGEGECRG